MVLWLRLIIPLRHVVSLEACPLHFALHPEIVLRRHISVEIRLLFLLGGLSSECVEILVIIPVGLVGILADLVVKIHGGSLYTF